MGEIIRGKRRRDCTTFFEEADDEIFIKRQRLNSEGDSNDSSDSDAFSSSRASSNPSPTAVQPVQAKAAEKPTIKFAGSGNASSRLRQQQQQTCQPRYDAPEEESNTTSGDPPIRSSGEVNVPCGEANASSSDVNAGGERQRLTTEAEDSRELNRRSPNGFLLPDPLPRGERLRDTMGQVIEVLINKILAEFCPEVLFGLKILIYPLVCTFLPPFKA